MTRIDHVGYVVNSIQDSISEFEKSTGLAWDNRIIHDRCQMVRIAFLGNNDEARIELVEPAGDRSPVKGFLEAGGGLHHVCYEVEDLALHIQSCQNHGATLVRVPMRAEAFRGRKIAWIVTASKQLVELLSAH